MHKQFTIKWSVWAISKYTLSKLSIFSTQYVNEGFCSSSPCMTSFTLFHRNNTTSNTRPPSGRISCREKQRENPQLKVSHPPLSSTHASYLQDWADKQNCAELSPAPPAPHSLGKETCVWLSGRSTVIHCYVEISAVVISTTATMARLILHNLPSGMRSSLPRLLSEHSRLLRLPSKASSDSAFLKGWPSRPWCSETKPIREALDPHTSETGGSCQELLTDKTCCISLVSLAHVSTCLKWNRSLMKLNADETLTLFSPGSTTHLRPHTTISDCEVANIK